MTTGQVNITSSLEASSTTVGSVALAGGLAVAKRVYALDMTVTNAITGSVTGTAATVTGAAQASITSLGTLTTLTVDNININGNTIISTDANGNINLTPNGIGINVLANAQVTSLTASEIVITDASKNLVSAAVATYPSLTELAYVKGVSSAIQTQIGTKAPSTAPTFATSITGSYLTASEILITGASKEIISAAVATYPSLTELTYVKGVTSAIQTQLNAKLALAGGTLTGSITLGENTSIALDPAGSADGKYTGITITGTAGATLAFGDLVYLKAADSQWYLTDADATATAGAVMIGMCVLAANDNDATNILLVGQIRADAKFPALTIGAPVYIGDDTAGTIETAIPAGADNVIRVVGFALTADEIYFNPSQDHQITVA